MIGIHTLWSAAAFASMAAAALPVGAYACQLPAFPLHRDGVHLIGTATRDTLPAGVTFGDEPGAAGRAIHGQVVRVERLGGADAALLAPGTDRVVLVPWNLGADCGGTRWTSSARWVQPGVRGLFWAALRPREEWVDGLPTLDVGDAYQPYPHQNDLDDPDSLMTVEQAFELMDLLPLFSEDKADPEAAHQPLLRWARENPALARRFPASVAIWYAELSVRFARLEQVDPPLAGTYRFSVSVDRDAPRTFYARTYAAPTGEWDPAENPELDDWRFPALDDPYPGYTLVLVGSAAADSLPIACEPDRDTCRGGFVSVAAEPETGPDGVQVWPGDLELGIAASALPGDAVLAGIERAAPEEGVLAPARFRMRPDGSVTMEQTLVLDDGRRVVTTGERVSRVTIPGSRRSGGRCVRGSHGPGQERNQTSPPLPAYRAGEGRIICAANAEVR